MGLHRVCRHRCSDGRQCVHAWVKRSLLCCCGSLLRPTWSLGILYWAEFNGMVKNMPCPVMPVKSTLPSVPHRALMRSIVMSKTRLFFACSVVCLQTMSSSACKQAGRRPSAIASAISFEMPAVIANGQCRHHSKPGVYSCPVMRMSRSYKVLPIADWSRRHPTYRLPSVITCALCIDGSQGLNTARPRARSAHQ